MGGYGLAETIDYERVVEALQSLLPDRQRALIARMDNRIRATAHAAPTADDLPMAALARRIYLFGLFRGREQKMGTGGGPPSPLHKVIVDELDDLASKLGIEGFGIVGEMSKPVELFCTHKVLEHSENSYPGFYTLTALYAWFREAHDGFDPKANGNLIPECEIDLSHRIFLFFARRLNEEAKAAGNWEQRPFPKVLPARKEDAALIRVPYFFVQHPDQAARATSLYETYKTPKSEDGTFGDDCAHFIMYRSRRSKPADLMKSILVIKPLVVRRLDQQVRYHPTFHVYQAPKLLGGARGTPGRVLALKPGLFIVGGQHAHELVRGSGEVREAGKPFRALEMIFLPWEGFDDTPLIGGLTMTVNRTGAPMIGRVCVRPTLIQGSEDARIGHVAVSELVTDLLADREAERAAAALARNVDVNRILDIYRNFEARATGDADSTIVGLAQRIAELCNNHSQDNWNLVPGLTSNGEAIRDDYIEGIFQDAMAEAVDARGEPFSVGRDLRIAPLGPLS